MNKYQNGGYMPPFIIWDAVEGNIAPATNTTTSDSSKKTEDNNIDDDLLKLLDKLDGLPSDVMAIAKDIQTYYSTSNLFGDSDISASNIANRYLSSLSKIKIANFNKKEYDEAKKQVTAKGGLNEIAITEDGMLAALTEQGIQQISLEDYRANPDKYMLLSNSKLLNYRAEQNPFDNTVLQVVSNGIGMDEVNKLIKASISNLGSSEVSQAGYTKIEQQQIADGFEYLKHAVQNGYDPESMGVDGLYKIDTLNKTQAQQAQQALMYAWSMLPLNAKTLIRLYAGSDENALNLVGSLITSGTSELYKFDTNLQLNKDGKKVGTEETSNSNYPDTNDVSRWLMGAGNKVSVILNGGTSYGLSAEGNVGTLLDEDENGTVAKTLRQSANGNFTGVLDWQNAYFGTNKINPAAMDKIITPDGKITRLELPVKIEQDGSIRPLLEMSELMEEAEELIRNQNIAENDYISKNQIYESLGLPTKYKPNGELDYSNYRYFGAINTQALDTAFGNIDESYVTRVTNKQDLQNIINNFKVATGEKMDATVDKWLFTYKNNKIYNGIVFIPILDNIFNAYINTKIPVDKTKTANDAQVISDMTRQAQLSFKPRSFSDGE